MHRIRRNIRGGTSRFTTTSLDGEEEHQHQLEEERLRRSKEKERLEEIRRAIYARVHGRLVDGIWDEVRQSDLKSLKGKKVKLNSLSERCITNKSSEPSQDERGVVRYPYSINNYHRENCTLSPADAEEGSLGTCIVTEAGREIGAECEYNGPEMPPRYGWIGIVTDWDWDRMGAIKIAVQFQKEGVPYLYFMEDLLIDVCDISTKNQYHFIDSKTITLKEQ